MPGLPINGRFATLAIPAVLALLALAAGPAMAQPKPPSVETIMYHMTHHRDVIKARKSYESAVQASMLYHMCAAEYGVDAAKKARSDQTLAGADRALRQAFTASHQLLTGKLPADKTIAAVGEYIAKLQHKEAFNVGTLVKNQKKGCMEANLRRVDKFYEAKYAYELQLQAAQAAAEEKRRLEAPAVIESPETKNH